MVYEELKLRLDGAITALVTPFRDGEVDHSVFSDFVEWQIDQGINGVSPCGTTGEAPTLNCAEKISLIKRCVEVSAKRVPVIAGTGTNDTLSTIALTEAAAAVGADAALIVTPYYNRPSQEGLFRHYEAIAKTVQIPIIVYNVPSRTGVDLSLETIERLAKLPSIIGIKDATGDLDRSARLTRRLGDRFIQLSGHDSTAVEFNLAGGKGTISVISNLFPHEVAAIHQACKRRDACTARTLSFALKPLLTAMELDTNPVPVKYALHHMLGFPQGVRLPLVDVNEEVAASIRRAIAAVHESQTGVQALNENRRASA